ncbi:MAG: MBL fold metallo-hydrolase [Lactobacillales bacterium]|jgi:glyoxylase-like metal-dependent hydrolase (beta-lactamase superfamily II)|nr:MBL fold metallo-hydrolase [Lactobacillales bacterium]
MIEYIVHPEDNEITYFIYDENDLILVDPGFAVAEIEDKLASLNINLSAIFLTHGHYDHIASVDELRHKYNAPVYIGEGDAEYLVNPDLNLSGAWRHPELGDIKTDAADFKLSDGETIKIGTLEFTVIHTPGHTSGGVIYYNKHDNALFTGDTLFSGTPALNKSGAFGRFDLPTGNLQDLIKSMKKIFALPPETKIYPGHSYYGTLSTVEFEKYHNAILDYME